MSQIGYMFVGVGLGAYGASMFTLMTRLLQGTALHQRRHPRALRRAGHPQDGRTRTRAALDHLRAFLIGALALAAIPPFAASSRRTPSSRGVIDQGTLGWILWAAGIRGAFLTSLYFRLLFIVFFEEVSPFAREHLRPGSASVPLPMMWPVAILAVLSTIAGFLQVPGGWSLVDDWLDPVVESVEEGEKRSARPLLDSRLACSRRWRHRRCLGPLSKARRPPRPRFGSASRQSPGPRAQALLRRGLRPHRPTAGLGARDLAAPAADRGPARPRSLGGLGTGVRDISGRVAAAQTGRVRAYVLALALGLAVLGIVFLLVARDPDDPHPASDRRGPRDLDRPVEHLEAAGSFALLVALRRARSGSA